MKILKTSKKARLGIFSTVDGDIQTPAFMNVATSAAIKGAVSAKDLKTVNCQVMLCNTYHLHIRPGEEIVKHLGGLHGFTGWKGPILTDSGGFQVFSLAKLREIEEKGVTFSSHVDGKKLFIGPEESMRIQSALGSTIAMAFDECISSASDNIDNPDFYNYAKKSCDRTVRWLYRCKEEMQKLNRDTDTINPKQMLFGINQGCTYEDLRVEHMKEIKKLDLDGYAIGGLSVGEPASEMYRIIDEVEPYMPKSKPRYLMGVGTPENIIESVWRGIDLFDCVMPSRNARHGQVFTWQGRRNLINQKYAKDALPIDENCNCPTCNSHSRGYIRHLFKSKEMLAMRLCVMHNLYFYNELMQRIRDALHVGEFEQFYRKFTSFLDRRI